MNKIIINNKLEMQKFAAQMAAKAKAGDVIGLKGTLGAGKSFFADAFINSLLDEKVAVLSPTFNLLYSYPTRSGAVHHFDLYRIKNEEELENIGFFDCLKDGICLIEWPEIAKKFLPKNYLEINIEIINDEKRIINIS